MQALTYIGQRIRFAFAHVFPENVGPFEEKHCTCEKASATNQFGDDRPLVGFHGVRFDAFVVLAGQLVLAAAHEDLLVDDGRARPIAVFAHRCDELPLIHRRIVDFGEIGILDIRLQSA